MQCPNCKYDYKKDEGERKGRVTSINDHDFRPFMDKGMICAHCGHEAKTLVIPTLVPFERSGRYDGRLESLVKEFQKQVFNLYKNRKQVPGQLDLYQEEESK